MDTKKKFMSAAVALLVVLFGSGNAVGAKLKDLCEIQGARGNILKGIGLVVGLAGTGDKGTLAILSQERLLERMNIDVKTASDLKSQNTAVVAVDAVFPPFGKEGTRIDVRVSSIGDAKSLEGGTLLDTHLLGTDDNVYAVAQGSLSVGGFNANGGGGGGSVRKNHVTVGRVPMGAYIEREIPSTITDGQRITLLLKRPDFGTAASIQEGINAKMGTKCATAFGAGTVSILIPENLRHDLVSFIAKIQQISVKTDIPSKIVINERTGTLVVGGTVIIKPCQVAHGNLTIKITPVPAVSQPLPFSGGTTVEVPVTDVEVEEKTAWLMPVEGTSAADVADALNKLKVTPRDMISIFQALRESGALEADLEIM